MKLRTSLIMTAGFVLVVFTVASTLLPDDLRAADFGHLSPELAAAILVGRLVVLAAVIAAGWWVLRPLAEVTRIADAIVAGDRSRRVAVSVPGTEAAHLAQALNLMLDQQQATEDHLRRFIADASHELRSPVASIRQHAEVALAHPDRATTAELATTVLADSVRVQRLVEDLLLLASADEHTLQQLPRRPVDLDDLVFDEARRLRDATDLRVDTTAVSAGRIDGDLAGLRRVLRNLGDNAARHARTRISFALAAHDSAVVLAVDDDGPGIPDGDRDRVLERFVRLDDARARDAGGSGLGLAIAAELVAAHGGTISIADSPLGGARIQVNLPGQGPPGD